MSAAHDILLAKWLSGEISQEEKLVLEDNYDLEYLNSLLQKQNEYSIVSRPNEDMWEQLTQKRGSNIEAIKTAKSNWLKYALGLLVLCLISFWLYSSINASGLKQVETKYKSNTPMAFSDGSRAAVGPNSLLSYSESNWANQRQVTLEGQAFFEVKKGVSFTVESEAGMVEVLGTQFDVWSIDKRYMQVFCKEGKVRVTDLLGNSKEITKNQSVGIRDSKIQNMVEESGVKKDWRDNFRSYQSIPAAIVFKDLERFYDLTIDLEINTPNIGFTGLLPTNDLEKCIRFIETSLPYESKKSANTILFSSKK